MTTGTLIVREVGRGHELIALWPAPRSQAATTLARIQSLNAQVRLAANRMTGVPQALYAKRRPRYRAFIQRAQLEVERLVAQLGGAR